MQKSVEYGIIIPYTFENSENLFRKCMIDVLREGGDSMCSHHELASIYRYFYLNREKDIFSNLTQLEFDSAEEYLTYIKEHGLAVNSYNERYVRRRFNTEKALYDQFVQKGGKPRTKHPYYFTLGKCDEWFYGRKGAFGCVEFLLDEFEPSVVSFTYGDSVPTFMSEFQVGKEYRGQVYTLPEIQKLVEKYGMPNEWNTYEQLGPENYIEVQIWSDEFVSEFSTQPTRFKELSANELSTRMLLSNNDIRQDLPAQKPLGYYIDKCKTHTRWSWFCELVNRVPPTAFCADHVHGIPHAHKCALIAFIIADELNLNTVDFNTLVYAAFFHDIGRKYYDNGKKHGVISSEKVASSICETDTVRMEQLKEALAKHDDRAEPNDDKNPFLLWLRDIDSLDYLRLGMGEYTTRYLKTKVAKALVTCVTELNVLMYLDDHQFIYKLTHEVKT